MFENNYLLKNIGEHRTEEISVLIRHAHRLSIPKGMIGHQNVPLTSTGRSMAYRFGRNLPSDTEVRLFHSPVPRCRETAECIKEGVISNNGSSVLIGEQDFLDTHAIEYLNRMVSVMEKIGGMKFIRKWLDGEIESSIMADPRKVALRIVKGITDSKKNKVSRQNTIDVHVTHDLNVLAVKEILLGIRVEDAGWPNYLEGVMFIHFPDHMALICEHSSKIVGLN